MSSANLLPLAALGGPLVPKHQLRDKSRNMPHNL